MDLGSYLTNFDLGPVGIIHMQIQPFHFVERYIGRIDLNPTFVESPVRLEPRAPFFILVGTFFLLRNSCCYWQSLLQDSCVITRHHSQCCATNWHKSAWIPIRFHLLRVMGSTWIIDHVLGLSPESQIWDVSSTWDPTRSQIPPGSFLRDLLKSQIHQSG